jgi:hypothetical protein
MAIGRLTVRKAAIRSVDIGDLTVARLQVGELLIDGKRVSAPSSGTPR